MDLKKPRLEKGWSQEQLADISGVSARTVQRLEKGEKPGMETLKALAAAFDVSSNQLQKQLKSTSEHESMSEQDKRVKNIIDYGWKGLFIHLGVFMAVITWLFILSASFGMKAEVIPAIAISWGGMLMVHAFKMAGDDSL